MREIKTLQRLFLNTINIVTELGFRKYEGTNRYVSFHVIAICVHFVKNNEKLEFKIDKCSWKSQINKNKLLENVTNKEPRGPKIWRAGLF